MRLLENAVKSIQLGVQDYNAKKKDRAISAVRNLYSGILLLFKEKLLRLSPPNSNEVLVKKDIVPYKGEDGTVCFKGIGKDTVNLNQIQARFKSLEIKVNWERVNKLNSIRNNLEHYYTEESNDALREALSNTFIIIRDFISKELSDDPLKLLGEKCWKELLDISEVYEKEYAECKKALDTIEWQSLTLNEAIDEAKCEICDSSLIVPIEAENYDYEPIDFRCKSCGNMMSYEDLVENCLRDHLSGEIYYSMKDGGDSPLEECPSCSKESYVIEEDKCAICGYEREYFNCALCGSGLEVWEQDFGGFCSYCDHVMSKDD